MIDNPVRVVAITAVVVLAIVWWLTKDNDNAAN